LAGEKQAKKDQRNRVEKNQQPENIHKIIFEPNAYFTKNHLQEVCLFIDWLLALFTYLLIYFFES